MLTPQVNETSGYINNPLEVVLSYDATNVSTNRQYTYKGDPVISGIIPTAVLANALVDYFMLSLYSYTLAKYSENRISNSTPYDQR